MWIKVQDKQTLAEAKIIEVSKGLLKKSKWSIIGKVSNTTDELTIVLGAYDTEDIANRVFSDIEQSILSDKKIFVMPNSEGF